MDRRAMPPSPVSATVASQSGSTWVSGIRRSAVASSLGLICVLGGAVSPTYAGSAVPQPGQCFNFTQSQLSGYDFPSRTGAVDCETAHTFEVVLVKDVPRPFVDAGLQAIATAHWRLQKCFEAMVRATDGSLTSRAMGNMLFTGGKRPRLVCGANAVDYRGLPVTVFGSLSGLAAPPPVCMNPRGGAFRACRPGMYEIVAYRRLYGPKMYGAPFPGRVKVWRKADRLTRDTVPPGDSSFFAPLTKADWRSSTLYTFVGVEYQPQGALARPAFL